MYVNTTINMLCSNILCDNKIIDNKKDMFILCDECEKK